MAVALCPSSPLTVALCPSSPVTVALWKSSPLTVALCHSSPVAVALCHSSPLTVILCPSSPLSLRVPSLCFCHCVSVLSPYSLSSPLTAICGPVLYPLAFQGSVPCLTALIPKSPSLTIILCPALLPLFTHFIPCACGSCLGW